jgi:microcystin-dependent protein
MKRNYTLLLLLLATVSILAQTPEEMSYQAVLRDASNTLLTNQEVGMQISILQNTATSAAVYVETQTPTTNLNGLVSLEIGTGSTSDSFASIDWSAGPYFIKIATDPNGGSSYSITGTSQLMSVPFAMYAKTSGSSIPGPQGEPGTNGTDGTQGIQGATGTPGAAGTNGTSGTKGDTGNVGEKGDTGAQGTQGIQGATGTSGAAGADGATGAAGTNGTQGIQGDTGSVGADGAAGTNGKNGDKGDTGDQGIQGETGTTGETGTPGTNGTNGDKGDTGIVGDKGNAGDKGDTGDQGAKGAKGDIGITGDKGDVGDKGNAGNTGDQGTQGIQGETGATGGTGAQGEQGTTGTTGSAGENGANGNNWISNILNPSSTFPGVAVGDQWLNTTSGDVFEWDGFTWNGTGNIQGINGTNGAPGIQGEAGTAGDKGDVGDQGETGAPGTNGTNGEKGDPGDQGTQGIQGETGVTGADINLPTAVDGNLITYDGTNWVAATPQDAVKITIANAGGNQSFNNRSPYLGLNYLIALEGIFPSRNSYQPFIGEIMLFGGNFVVTDWAFCDGQLLAIMSNTALFSILGTTYGGDGRTTFALPDLRGRSAIHVGTGTGPGLSTIRLGDRSGAETTTLTTNNLPSHTHTVVYE